MVTKFFDKYHKQIEYFLEIELSENFGFIESMTKTELLERLSKDSKFVFAVRRIFIEDLYTKLLNLIEWKNIFDVRVYDHIPSFFIQKDSSII